MISPKRIKELENRVSDLESSIKSLTNMVSKIQNDHNNLTDALVRKTLLRLHQLEAENPNKTIQNFIEAAAESSGELFEEIPNDKKSSS